MSKWYGGRAEHPGSHGRVFRRAASAAVPPHLLLYEQSLEINIDVHTLDDEDYVEDYLFIDRVEPGAPWFEGGIGPVAVPAGGSELARPGWSVSIVLGRKGATWHILEVGNAYP